MKIGLFNSTLSCISKSIRFLITVSIKKKIIGLFIFSFISACAAPTAMLGPAYTLTSSGNVIQAGMSYGSNQLVTTYTGKTPIENLQEIIIDNKEIKKNIQKKTLESEEFHNLVKKKIDKTSGILNLTSQ